jgi:rare lipoprotein A
VRVTNPENQKSVIIRINDRGPFHSDRLIDLSYAASYKLGLAGKGSGIVDVEAIDPRKFVQNAPPASAPKAMPPTEASSVIVEPLKTANIPAPTVIESTSSSTSPSTQGKLTPPPVSGAFVQVGAFKSAENAELLSRKITGQNLVENTPVNSWYNQGIHRVRIGPYANRSEAELAAAKVKKALGLNTYIVD